ncbi:uncharacterized protein LOC116142592 [Pistacia vera]|uniref:uncharacterized protein LOC116142592 n=1 Tax=Pistacia vera TaxID=55513 RepID=UPI001263A68B|nr:uncharacterized protein LOC116142592 [Pistacia vera]
MEESGKRFDKNEAQLQKYEILLQNQSASIRNLETQMGQIHSILARRVQGMFSSDIKKNPKEQLNAIMLRSGKELKESRKAEDMKLDRTNNASAQCLGTKPELENKAQDVKKDEASLPYPHRLQKQRLDKQFGKFMDMFRSLHINIPSCRYVRANRRVCKFLKEILTHKGEHERIMLTEECSALLQRNYH